jgi:hypothetical protein
MASIISAGTTSGTALNMAGDTSGVLQLATNGSTTAITIDTSQNVGIGTASPDALLTVNTIASFGDGAVGTPSIAHKGDLNTGIFFPAADTIAFAEGGAESMRIDSSGSLLINTTSNIALSSRTVPLQILQDNNLRDAITIKANSSTYNFSSINFLNASGSQVGYIYMNASNTQYSTSSDYRLKDNIAPMTGALDKVLQLKPCTYTWKQDGSDGQGFIAHELQEIVPDCVTGEKDAVDADGNPKYQGVDTSFLVATLTAAIQEQQTIINDLTARITALEGAA